MSIAECSDIWKGSIIESNYCANDPNNKTIRNDCEGDNGGPLQFIPANSTIATVVGVVSFGDTTCGAELPGVYTRVASYVDWIEAIVWRIPN